MVVKLRPPESSKVESFLSFAVAWMKKMKGEVGEKKFERIQFENF
jgi:hypothetical protein